MIRFRGEPLFSAPTHGHGPFLVEGLFRSNLGELVFASWISDAVRSSFQQGDVRDSRKCCKCGELGHVSRECPTTVKVRCRWAVKDTSRKIALT